MSGSGGSSSCVRPDDSQLEQLCEKLLANPLIEDYEIEIL